MTEDYSHLNDLPTVEERYGVQNEAQLLNMVNIRAEMRDMIIRAAKQFKAPIVTHEERDGCYYTVIREGHLPTAAAIENRAKDLYEASRKKVSGRPPWHRLNPNDPYDAGMKQRAYAQAQAEGTADAKAS